MVISCMVARQSANVEPIEDANQAYWETTLGHKKRLRSGPKHNVFDLEQGRNTIGTWRIAKATSVTLDKNPTNRFETPKISRWHLHEWQLKMKRPIEISGSDERVICLWTNVYTPRSLELRRRVSWNDRARIGVGRRGLALQVDLLIDLNPLLRGRVRGTATNWCCAWNQPTTYRNSFALMHMSTTKGKKKMQTLSGGLHLDLRAALHRRGLLRRHVEEVPGGGAEVALLEPRLQMSQANWRPESWRTPKSTLEYRTMKQHSIIIQWCISFEIIVNIV